MPNDNSSAENAMPYAKHYSAPHFWSKLRGSSARAGKGVLEKALCLYYALGASTTPAWAKAAIGGALGYFVLPLDAIPDVIVGVGFSDDLVVLVAALATVAAHVMPEHVSRAKQTLGTWSR